MQIQQAHIPTYAAREYISLMNLFMNMNHVHTFTHVNNTHWHLPTRTLVHDNCERVGSESGD